MAPEHNHNMQRLLLLSLAAAAVFCACSNWLLATADSVLLQQVASACPDHGHAIGRRLQERHSDQESRSGNASGVVAPGQEVGLMRIEQPSPLDKSTCKRMLWLSGLQAFTPDGSEARYLESSSSYLRFYAAALRSAQRSAPSLLHVLVFLNAPPGGFLEWAQAQDTLVIQHTISFTDRISAAVKAQPGSPQAASLEHLVASYARLDVPAIMQKVRPALEARGNDVSSIDFDYVLWTDPDVLFMQDIDGCSLPRPRLVSIGPEVMRGTVENCGTMYFNVSAYAQTLPALLDFADGRRWKFDHDQDLFRKFYERWMFTALPDAFNYKPYWGLPEHSQPARIYRRQGLPEVSIIHTHGPKPDVALCIMGWAERQGLALDVQRDVLLKPRFFQQVTKACGMEGTPWPEIVLLLGASAAAADGGALYRQVHEMHQALCPGRCWEGVVQ